ncbi:class I SAM-dependent methyltransferase [Asanoa sp. NPDC049518]|uniref:class I SAM-dependent methyltransferase n=1 Tax=unclassified Asanoa TaxID=2685164 RepID=UPI0034369C34
MGFALPAGRTWDASAYHRVSVAMDAMAAEVLDRLPLDGSETVLDAGCGTGRISAKLLARLPRGRLIAVDADPEMVTVAQETLPEVLRVDLLDLALPELDEMLSYLETVPLGPWAQRVPPSERAEFVASVWGRTPGDTVDYVRLNITGRRG